MGKECEREEAAKIDSAQKEAVAEMATANDAGRTGEEQGVGGPPLDGISTSNSLSADEEDRYPNKMFFKCGSGFVAWALWGHSIPILDRSDMQCDAKKKALFGRKPDRVEGSVSEIVGLKKWSVCRQPSREKRCAEEEEASTLTPTPVDSSRILAKKALQYMLAAESIKNKRQKLAGMGG